MAPDDLTLEKLKIDHRLQNVEENVQEIREMIAADKEDRREFRQELKEAYKRHEGILFGDGGGKSGLVTRTKELETAHGIHAKVVWTAATGFIALATKTIWDFFTGRPHA